MKKGMTRWVSIVIAVALVGAMLLTGCANGTKAPKEYVIGGMQALSGPGYAAVIDYVVDASKLAVHEINEAGGIDGVPLKIVWEDHKARGPDAVSALNKLIDINKVPVSTIGYTAPVMATAPVAEERETLLINHGAYGPAIVGCGEYTFHLTANELVLIRAMLDYAKKEDGIKKLGLIYVNDDMGLSVKDFLIDYCPKVGLTLVGTEAFDLAATDYSAQIAKAKAWGADAIYLSVHKHPITKQAYEAGFHPLWIGCPLYTISEFTKWGPGIEDAIGAAADVSFDRNPGMVKLKKSWEDFYGAGTFPTAALSYLADGYDYVYIVKDLIEYGKEQGWEDYWTGKRLRQALKEKMTFSGAIGEMTFDIETGCCSRNVDVFEAVPNPDKPGEYKWKEVAFYTGAEIAAMG